MNVLIGSRAWAYWNNNSIRESADYDVISNTKLTGTEWHNPNTLNNNTVQQFTNKTDYIFIQGTKVYIASRKLLACIKRSHLFRKIKFQSHITQYYKQGMSHWFNESMKDKEYRDFYEERVRLTKEEFGDRYPKLNKDKDTFFTDAVTRKYDHDYLHSLISYPNKPMYKSILIDYTSVLCSVYLWNRLTHNDKLLCVYEEVVVTALERFIIPNKLPTKLAYLKSLDKVCTTMCSGWFRDYAIDNYEDIFSLYNKEIFITTLNHLGEPQ